MPGMLRDSSQEFATTLWITCSCSKYTTKPGYSQREMGGLPTAGVFETGAPNFVDTWSMVIPRAGVATSDSLTAMPFSTAIGAALADPFAQNPESPAATTASTIK